MKTLQFQVWCSCLIPTAVFLLLLAPPPPFPHPSSSLPFCPFICVYSAVKAIRSPSQLELWCQYSERSQVERAGWRHHNLSRRLPSSSHSPGVIITSLALPIGSDAAGNYTCTLQLRNRQTIWAMHTVALPPEGGTNSMKRLAVVDRYVLFEG